MSKLIAAKEQWARSGRLMMPQPREIGRLPPGQHLVADWPVLDLGNQPNLRPADWRLRVGGLVDRPQELDWIGLQRLGQGHFISDIHCVTSWSRYDNQWQGVAAATLLAQARPLPTARYAILRSYDSYATTVPLDDLMRPDVLFATGWAGEPLSRSHGGPVRLIIPHLYLWKSAKWIRQIWLTDRDVKGYWEARGYHDRGDPWRQQRYG